MSSYGFGEKTGPKPRLYFFNGKNQSLADWSQETGIPLRTLRSRVNERLWSPEKAFTVPVDQFSSDPNAQRVKP